MIWTNREDIKCEICSTLFSMRKTFRFLVVVSTLFFRSCTILLLLTQSSKWLWIITHHQYNFNCNILNWQMNFLIQKTTNFDYVTFELLLKFLNQWDDGFLQILFCKMLTRLHLSWILMWSCLVFNYLDKNCSLQNVLESIRWKLRNHCYEIDKIMNNYYFLLLYVKSSNTRFCQFQNSHETSCNQVLLLFIENFFKKVSTKSHVQEKVVIFFNIKRKFDFLLRN